MSKQNTSELEQMTLAATIYAEEYGIVDYRFKDWIFTYNVSYPAYLGNPRYTMQFKVDLRTSKVIERKKLKKYDTRGEYNRG